MRSNYKPIGDYIEKKKVKNSEDKYSELLGINIDKFFMPSVANVIGTNLSRYLIVKPGQFACNRMHVGRDYRIPVALSEKEKPFIVSPAYDVFEIKDTSQLLPEYLMMWFSRSEFDRNAWYYTDADVRGGLAWEAFFSIELPVPSIEKQREIVAEYNVIKDRIALNEQLNQKLEETAQALYRHWFVDFEFPNENGKPYKSFDGAMVYNVELDKEIPEGWEVENLNNFLEVKYGKDYKQLGVGTIPLYGSGGIMKYVDSFLYDEPSVLIPRKGTLTNIIYVDEPFWSVDTMFFTKIKQENFGFYSFYYLKTLDFNALNVGSAVPSMTTKLLNSLRFIFPDDSILEKFNNESKSIFNFKKIRIESNVRLEQLQDLVLSKMARVEENVKPELIKKS